MDIGAVSLLQIPLKPGITTFPMTNYSKEFVISTKDILFFVFWWGGGGGCR